MTATAPLLLHHSPQPSGGSANHNNNTLGGTIGSSVSPASPHASATIHSTTLRTTSPSHSPTKGVTASQGDGGGGGGKTHRSRSRSVDARKMRMRRDSHDDWEIDADEVSFGPRIGSGSFGVVYKGKLLFSFKAFLKTRGVLLTRCIIQALAEPECDDSTNRARIKVESCLRSATHFE